MLVADLRIAWLSLVEHRRRALFLGGAISGVTMLLVLLTSLSTGVRTTLIETATTLSTGHVNVGGFFKVTGGMAIPAVTHASKVVEVATEAVPELEFAVQRGRGWAKLVSATGSMQAGIGGIDIGSEQRFRRALSIVDGSLDGLEEPGTILLFREQADKLGVRAGDALTISAQTTRGVNNTVDCRVAAIAKDVGMLSKFNVFIPAASLRELYQYRPDTTGAVQLYVRGDAVDDLGPITARLRTALQDAGYGVMDPDDRPFWMKFDTVSRQAWTGQKLDVTTWEGELSFLTWTLSAIDGLSWVLLVILVAIVIAGIMNTMWIAIRERTREIGTLRAIGMQRVNVVRMLLLESVLLGLFGALLGAGMGAGLASLITSAHLEVPLAVQLFLMSDEVRLIAEPGAVLRAVLLLTAVTGLAALQPALRAARLRPVDAMSHFG
ncbi:MAG: FtsX-like permease family protein [Myxococcales bacterium]|nr:FtsX-like permease family protein [Myxococcales bacterium]